VFSSTNGEIESDLDEYRYRRRKNSSETMSAVVAQRKRGHMELADIKLAAVPLQRDAISFASSPDSVSTFDDISPKVKGMSPTPMLATATCEWEGDFMESTFNSLPKKRRLFPDLHDVDEF